MGKSFDSLICIQNKGVSELDSYISAFSAVKLDEMNINSTIHD